jgi:hypothetical protein
MERRGIINSWRRVNVNYEGNVQFWDIGFGIPAWNNETSLDVGSFSLSNLAIALERSAFVFKAEKGLQ